MLRREFFGGNLRFACAVLSKAAFQSIEFATRFAESRNSDATQAGVISIRRETRDVFGNETGSARAQCKSLQSNYRIITERSY